MQWIWLVPDIALAMAGAAVVASPCCLLENDSMIHYQIKQTQIETKTISDPSSKCKCFHGQNDNVARPNYM